MSITNYTQLQTAVQSWLDHTLFSANVPDFIALFEAAANRNLRTREMVTTGILTTSSGAATLPTDYLAWRRVTWTGSPFVELKYVAPDYFKFAFPTAPADRPRVFTIEGTQIKVMPTDDSQTVEMSYYAKIPALASAATNWLLSAHPDVYLFGALVESANFGNNDERMPMWQERRDRALVEIQALANKSMGGTAQQFVANYTP